MYEPVRPVFKIVQRLAYGIMLLRPFFLFHKYDRLVLFTFNLRHIITNLLCCNYIYRSGVKLREI